MSLLIKALEQAAKDRKAGRVEPPEAEPVPAIGAERRAPAGAPAGAPSSLGEPTLEPPPAPRAAVPRQQRPEPPERPAAAPRSPSPPPASAATPVERPAPARRAATSLAELQANDAHQQRARAATVMQAGGGAASQAIAFLRANPVIMFGALAVLAGLVFGIYVYLQIANPRLFTRQAATQPQPPAQPVPPAPPAADAGVPGAPPATLAATPEPVPPAPGSTGPSFSGTIGSSAGAPPLPVPPPAATAPGAAPPGQVPAASVIATAPPLDTPRALPVERAPEPRAPRAAARGSEDAPRSGRAAPATLAAAEPGGRERINVSPTAGQPRINPQLSQAYTLMQSGNLEEARAMYTRVTQAEPLNIDAQLGLAYIAAQENRSEDAVRLYLRILQLNPRHAVAQAALIGLMGRADPTASESRLKQLIAREPSPFLHFVLGNLYSDQGQWAQAQQAYFQAHHLEPDNPDYAYNLAVGLDQLRQPKLALNYYRRAESLAQARGQSNFNLSHTRERIRTLTTQLE